MNDKSHAKPSSLLLTNLAKPAYDVTLTEQPQLRI
jgi:hypothetical protein